MISFFLTSFAGFLWIGRGVAALIVLAVMALMLVVAVYFGGFAVFVDDSGLTGVGGETFGALIDYLLVGLVHVAIVLPFRRSAQPQKWYSNGFAVVGLALFLPLFLAVGVRTLLFQPFSIPAGSMMPALEVGDHLFVSKYAYGYSRYSAPFGLLPVSGRVFAREPERGDIVVFKFPPNPSIDYVKRVIGLPGDRVQIVDGVVRINGPAVGLQRTDETRSFAELDRDAEIQIETLPNGVSYQILSLVDDAPGDNTREYVVPEGHYFVLGDNRDNSLDSRFNVGFVPFDHLVGRAERIYWNSEGVEFADRADIRPNR